MGETEDRARPLAVVTGAGSGIGRATTLLLVQRGFTVAAGDLRKGAAEETAGGAEHCRAFEVDVADDASVGHWEEAVRHELGSPSVVVNCAGWDETRPFLETTPEFWKKVVDINYLGVVRVTHAFARAMVAEGRGGRIVNVASDAGRVGSSGETVYAGAKGGVIAFTKSIAREFARYGITANAVCPGPTETPLFRNQPEKLQTALEQAVPMKRLAQPTEVAAAIAFFASQESAYVTGQVISVSGGLTMAG